MGDEDTVTKVTGMKEKRQEEYKKNSMLRHLYPRNGTPEMCKNDRMHGCLELEIGQENRELSARCKDWTKLPKEELLENGRNFMTQRGYVRGPTHYIIGMAIANVWLDGLSLIVSAPMSRLAPSARPWQQSC